MGSAVPTHCPRAAYSRPPLCPRALGPHLLHGMPGVMNLDSVACARCDDGFEPKAKIVNSNGELFHSSCFVCAQCFRPFPDGVFYEFEGRKYCEHDFHVLFAPCCSKCGESIIDGDPLRFRGEVYHPYHFSCTGCKEELTATAREVRTRPGYTANELNELYCLRCHDKMGIPICGACRRPIEERVVTALGKHWHVEHFVCAKCEKPFLGNRHYERKGLAYCETHYHQLFGNLCQVCNQVIQGDVFTALNKAWCVNHFACSSCDQKMTVKTKLYEVDLKPVCKKCYDRYPREMRLRLKKYHESEATRDQRAGSV